MSSPPDAPGGAALLRAPWIPLTLRKKLGKALGAPAAGRDFAAPLFGTVYRGRTGNHMDDKIYLYGAHEPATLRLIRAVLGAQRAAGRSPVYLDVGANAGQHMLAAAGLADAVHGFEPYPPMAARARANLEANGLTHAALHELGLSDRDAWLPFRAPTTNNYGTGGFVSAPDDAPASADRLQVRRGDAVLAELGIRPSLIKIDTEGFEVAVLSGLAETIARLRPAVIFEYDAHSRAQLADPETRRRLFGADYRFFGLRRSREYPRLDAFRPDRKYENVLAYPEPGPPPTA